MANDHDEVIQLYKEPMKALAHVFLYGANDQFEEIGRMWQRMKMQRKDNKPLSEKLSFTIRGLIEFVHSERFEAYADQFDQDPARMRRAMLEKLAGEEKTCPKCEKTGRVLYQFGFRKIGERLFVQSWCLRCRNKQ